MSAASRGLSDAQANAAREAVASMQEAMGLARMAEQSRAGEADQLIVMQCAFAAAEAVIALGEGADG